PTLIGPVAPLLEWRTLLPTAAPSVVLLGSPTVLYCTAFRKQACAVCLRGVFYVLTGLDELKPWPIGRAMLKSVRASIKCVRKQVSLFSCHSSLLRSRTVVSTPRKPFFTFKRFFSHRSRAQARTSCHSNSRMHTSDAARSFTSTSYDPAASFTTRLTTAIPISAGLLLLAILHLRRVKRREEVRLGQREPNDLTASRTQLQLYRLLPWRLLSRAWGSVHSWTIPESLRPILLGLYAKTFHCDLHDAVEPEIRKYRNLGEFFRRRVKPEARPINSASAFVSPCDGQVLAAGPVTEGKVEQVKGVTYSLNRFLGHSGDVEDLLHDSEKNTLYQMVIYLAPGDYHQFFSPVQWVIEKRKHFPGDLLSVSPSVAAWIRDLFVLNERAVYSGQWTHGFFSMTAVGATNVGSIRVPMDAELNTNRPWDKKNKVHTRQFATPVAMRKGELLGEFNLGSTIVLLFEAPKTAMSVEDGRKLLGHIQIGKPLLKMDFEN
ncbi:unnamed protein product, partial [Cyprideis torosa]